MKTHRYIKWDEITHGQNPDWQYIRWKENTESLKVMAPYLRKAFAKRIQLHEENNKRKSIIAILEEVIYLLRMLKNKKDGVPKV